MHLSRKISSILTEGTVKYVVRTALRFQLLVFRDKIVLIQLILFFSRKYVEKSLAENVVFDRRLGVKWACLRGEK